MKKILFPIMLAFAVLVGSFPHSAFALGSVSISPVDGGTMFNGSGFTSISEILVSITSASGAVRSSGNVPVSSGTFSYLDAAATPGSSYTYEIINTADNTTLTSGSFTAGSIMTTGGSSTGPVVVPDTGTGPTVVQDPGTATFDFHISNPVRGFDNIPDLIAAILKIVMLIATPIVGVMIIYTGFLFVTARGDESQLKKAKANLLYVVIGAAIILGAQVIATAIQGTVNSLI